MNVFTEPVQSTRSRDRALTRVRVIDAAQRLFAERGFRATTVRDIAAEAGVSVGSVMAVGDKDALLLAAFDRWIGAVHEARAAGLIPPPQSTDPVVRIGELIAPFLALFDANLPLAREYGAVLARGTHRTEVFGSLALSLTAEFTGVLAGAGLGDEAESAGRTVYLAYLGLLLASAALGTDLAGVRTQLDEVVTVLVRRAGD